MTREEDATTIRGTGGAHIGTEALIGQVLDHYRVLEALGAGGMGEVYRAHDEQLGRDVALKVLAPANVGDDAARARLLHEARLASALNHPNICTIYQVGGTGPQPFIAMEYIAGRTLSELTLAGPLPAEQALTYAIQIADALEHAHARGVIHRDLKCANVIATSADRVKVLDFGLAKRIEGGELDAVTMSMASIAGPGAIVGTLSYMAPEALRGGAASMASDIWSFGVLLFQMVTGKLPFQGQSAYDLTTSIMRDPPPPIETRVPAGLNNVLERCLSKEPTQRYATGGELRAALQAVAAGARVRRDTSRASWRVRIPLFVTAAILAALCVWGTMRLFRMHPAGPDSVAILPFANRGGSPETEYLSDGLTDDLIEALNRLPNVKVASHTSVFRYKGKEISPEQVGRELGVKAVLLGSVMVHDGGVAVDAELIDAASHQRLWNGHYSRALSDSVALKDDLTQEITAKLAAGAKAEMGAAATVASRNNDAYQAQLKGMYHMNRHTPEELEQARQYFEAALAADPTYASAYAGLSAYYSILADSGLAAPATTLVKARAAAQKALQLDPKVGVAQNSLAYIKLVYDWDFPGAEAEFRRLIAAQPNTADYHKEFAICLRTLGRTEEAIASARKAIALDPLNMETSADLAWTYYFAHHFDEAIGQFRDTLVLDPSYAPAHFGMGLSFNQRHMEGQAAAEFEKYLGVTAGEESGVEFRNTYRKSGYSSAMRGLWEFQLNVLKQQAQQEYVSPMLFASTYALLGRKDEAFEWLDKAYAERSIRLLDLKVDPDFDSLRQDPRFAQLTTRVGLP